MLAMADGYAQATGRPALVNLHSAAGLGNAMGKLANARARTRPLVITAGQQARAMVGLGSVLAEPAMTRVPEPQVKWACEPARAQDVPRALVGGVPPGHAAARRARCSCRCRWTTGRGRPTPEEVALLPGRRVRWAGAAPAQLVDELVGRLRAAPEPGAGGGPARWTTSAAFDLVVALAERLRAAVWTAPDAAALPVPHPAPAVARRAAAEHRRRDRAPRRPRPRARARRTRLPLPRLPARARGCRTAPSWSR